MRSHQLYRKCSTATNRKNTSRPTCRSGIANSADLLACSAAAKGSEHFTSTQFEEDAPGNGPVADEYQKHLQPRKIIARPPIKFCKEMQRALAW